MLKVVFQSWQGLVMVQFEDWRSKLYHHVENVSGAKVEARIVKEDDSQSEKSIFT